MGGAAAMGFASGMANSLSDSLHSSEKKQFQPIGQSVPPTQAPTAPPQGGMPYTTGGAPTSVPGMVGMVDPATAGGPRPALPDLAGYPSLPPGPAPANGQNEWMKMLRGFGGGMGSAIYGR